jgi:imidazolonepropionase-like amidohydrolase
LVIYSFAQERFAISHVNIIDPKSKQIIKNQTIYIENGMIKSMGSSITYPKEVNTINGSGKYLLPGLAEMHAHIPVPDSSGNIKVLKQTIDLFLVNGVTTLRGMLGQPYHLNILEDLIKKGSPSPAIIYTSSPSLNGNTLPDEATAERLVKQYKKEGYHFLKIHPGIKRPVYDAVVSTAKAVKMDFAGHVPVEVGIYHAATSGQKTIDHMDGMIEALAPPLPDINQNGFFGFNVTELIDDKKIKSVVSHLKKTGAWIVPTQSLFTRWFSTDDPKKMINEKELSYMPSRTRYAWLQSKTNMQSAPGFTAARYQQFLSARQKLLKELYLQNVPLLMGSDAPQVMNVPGFSIHHEMKSWADAGIPNWEILRAATVNVSRFFNTGNTTGEIKKGRKANFILLSSNPVDNIENTKSIEGVIGIDGKWIAKADIERILEKIAKENE